MKSIQDLIKEGAWEYDSLKSDETLDLRDDFLKQCTKQLKDICKKLNKKHDGSNSYRTIGLIDCWITMLQTDKSWTIFVDDELLKLFSAALSFCKIDFKWIKSWSDESKISKQLDEYEQKLKDWQKEIKK